MSIDFTQLPEQLDDLCAELARTDPQKLRLLAEAITALHEMVESHCSRVTDSNKRVYTKAIFADRTWAQDCLKLVFAESQESA